MNGYVRHTEPSINRLYKTKHIRSSVFGYSVGLDLAKTSYLAGWIKKIHKNLG